MSREQKTVPIIELHGGKVGDEIRYSIPVEFILFPPIELDYDGFPKSPSIAYEAWIIVRQNETHFFLERVK